MTRPERVCPAIPKPCSWHLACSLSLDPAAPLEVAPGKEGDMAVGVGARTVRVQFVPVRGRRREWMWKARDESNTITISGQRFDSLGAAVEDARGQIEDGDDSDGPFAA